MQKRIKVLLTILTVLILAVSCAKNNPNDPNDPNDPTEQKPTTKEGMLQQKWKYNNYDGGYNITADKVDDYAGNAINYSIAIEAISWNADNKSGIIYGKYTKAPNYNPDVANKYYAISFKDLTADTIKISGAYKADGVSATDTLEEAKTTFTEKNGYFGAYSDLKAVR